MTTTVNARNLRLQDVQGLLKFQEQLNDSITSLLFLESLTEFEQQELLQIRNVFRSYYAEGTISEGQIKFLFLAPLMKLAGFYQPNIKITLEENIDDIHVEDEDTNIKGRIDILAVNRTQGRTVSTPFWIVVIESKNSSINSSEGLPQLLTYAYQSLESQTFVWGLTTNGMDYQFAYLQQGNPPTYREGRLKTLEEQAHSAVFRTSPKGRRCANRQGMKAALRRLRLCDTIFSNHLF